MPAEPAAHLPGGDLVARMGRQPRVQHRLKRRVSLEVAGDGHGAVGGAPHPQKQRPHAALQQPRLERAQHGAGVAPPGADPLPEGIAAGGQHRPGQHVAVAVEVLGGGVDHQVGAQLQGPGVHRGRHRVVDRHPHPGGVGQRADGGQIGDLPHRVGRRLDPDQAGAALADGRPQGVQVGGVDELHIQAPGERELGQPLAHPQYSTRETSTWSPGSRAWKTAVAAAIPEANSAQAQPAPSSAASRPSAGS
jgi:hypothetical protein